MPFLAVRRSLLPSFSRFGSEPFRRAGVIAGVLLSLLPMPPALAQPVESPRFEIRDYRVDGATLIPPEQIGSLLAAYRGPGRSFDDIDRALQALRSAYARLGYRGVVVRLPEQEIEGGMVRILVTEWRVEAVEVNGPAHFKPQTLREALPMLAPGQPIDFDRLGRALDVINENPALKAAVEIRQGSRDDQRQVVIAGTDEDPLTRFVSLDDTGTAATGRHRLGVGLRHADIGGRADTLTLQFVVSAEKPSAASFWGAGYRLPLPAHGLAAEAYLGHSDVNSGTVAGLFDVAGKGSVAGLRLAAALDRLGAYRHQLSAAIDYRDFRNRVSVNGGASLVPDYTVHPVSLAYSGELGASSFALTAVQGFPGGARSNTATLQQARTGADARYSLWRYSASHTEPLAGDWRARAGLSGQLTSGALVPGEQFGLGGAQSVRGFDERHVAGDSGARLGLEIHAPAWQAERFDIRPLAFVDYGELRRNQVQPGELAREAIASVGVGIRLQLPRQLTLALDGAHVRRGTASQPAGRERLHLAVHFTF